MPTGEPRKLLATLSPREGVWPGRSARAPGLPLHTGCGGLESLRNNKKRADDAKMHGQRAPPPPAATTPEVDTDREQTPRSESGLPGWMRSVTQCGRPSGGRKPPFNNTDQTYATNHDELHSRDDDDFDFDDASSVSTTVSSEMNTDLLDTSLEACSFGSFAVGSRDTLGRRGKARKSGAARRRKARARTDLALATFGREAAVLASADAVVAARWAVVAAVKAEVRAEAEAKEVSTRTRRRARWAARRAAAAARTAAMAARDERSVVFYILHFDYKINMWAAGGLVRCRSGRRGVGNGRRRRERESGKSGSTGSGWVWQVGWRGRGRGEWSWRGGRGRRASGRQQMRQRQRQQRQQRQG